MSKKTQPDLSSKMGKLSVQEKSQKPESSGGRSASKIPVPVSKKSATAVEAKKPPQEEERTWTSPPPRIQPSRAAKKPVGPGAKSPPTSLKDIAIVAERGVAFSATKKLGFGAEGEVWLAHFNRSTVEFAVKQVRLQKITNKAKLAKADFVKFAKEAQNQRKCAADSPTLILPIYAWSVETTNDWHWLVSAMPVSIGTLEKLLGRYGIKPEFKGYILLFTLTLAECVAVLHRLRIVHADLHPANLFVFLDKEFGYRLVIGDFGQSVDFLDREQVAAEVTVSEDDALVDPEAAFQRAADAREKVLQARDCHAIADMYLRMRHGGGAGLRLNVERDITSKDGSYHNKLTKNERCFVNALTDASGDRIPAKHVKLLPLFQGDNAADPSWAVDLKQLDKDHRSTFVENLDRKAGTLIDQLHAIKNGMKTLKLRKQDPEDELAKQRTSYTVGGQLRGIDEPCLFPTNIACHCPPPGVATGCPKLTLYTKTVFERHAHDGSTPIEVPAQELVLQQGERAEAIRPVVEKTRPTRAQNLVYAPEIKLCACPEKKLAATSEWADVMLHDVHHGEKHFYARQCVHPGQPPSKAWYDDGAVAEDALHLSELVDAVRDRSREVWCALINFFKGTEKSAVGKDAKNELLAKKIKWSPINPEELEKEFLAAQSKLPGPSGSKR